MQRCWKQILCRFKVEVEIKFAKQFINVAALNLEKVKKKDNTIKGQSKTSNPTKYIAINFDDLNFET